MKKIYLILFICVAFVSAKATSYTIAISGFAYSPPTLTVSVGDVVTIQATAVHPTAQVDLPTWTSNGTVTVGGGWGVKTASYTFTISTVANIYYVCQNHVASFGMKGMITVNATGVKENNNFLQNFVLYPNPAQNNVQLNLGLTTSTNVSVKLFNLLGQEVSVLTSNSFLPEGNHNFNYELPSTLVNGSYFMEVSSDNKKATKKLIVNR